MNPVSFTLVGLGLASLEYGLVLVSIPAALIVGGLILLIGGALGAEVKTDEDVPR